MLALEAAEKSVQAPLALPNDVQELAFGPDAVLRSQNPQLIRRVGLELPNAAFTEQAVLQQGKPQATKKVTEAPRMLKPGTTGKQSTAEQDAMKKMRAKLAKSGDRRDAARLFEKFI